jgi:outer membrane protein TolC
VMGARETLRVTEQQVLLDAATAYMNLLRDQAILDLNRRNVEVPHRRRTGRIAPRRGSIGVVGRAI